VGIVLTKKNVGQYISRRFSSMKLAFTAKFRTPDDYREVHNQQKLSDLFLVFLPKKFELSLVRHGSYDVDYSIKLEMDQVLSLEEITEKLQSLGVTISNFKDIKREFTKKELEEVKKRVCFKEIFKPSEAKK